MNILRNDGTTVQLFGKTYYEMREDVFNRILKLYVFDDPTPGRGVDFRKYSEYVNGNRDLKEAIDALEICYKMACNDTYDMYAKMDDFVMFMFNLSAHEIIGVKRKNIANFIKYMEYAKNQANIFVYKEFLKGAFEDFETSLLEQYIDDESVEFIYFQNDSKKSFWIEDGKYIDLERARKKMVTGLCDIMEYTFGRKYKLVEKSTGEIEII